MCGHSVTFSRSPLSGPLAPVGDRCQEVACVKTSGEAVMETPELLLVTRREDLQCRGERLLGRLVCRAGLQDYSLTINATNLSLNTRNE